MNTLGQLRSLGYSLSFGEFRCFGVSTQFRNFQTLRNSPAGIEILIFAVKYDITLI